MTSVLRARARPHFGSGLVCAVVCAAIHAGCSKAQDEAPPAATRDPDAALLGGETTIFDTSSNAFTFAARNLSPAHRDAFALGDHFFNRAWVAAPASIEGNDGLGPTFNALSCSTCHLRDGRGAPPASPGEPFVGLLVRLSVPGSDAHGGPLDEPTYGGQLNPDAILGVPGEGTPHVKYTEIAGAYADGEPYALRAPEYSFTELAFGAFAAGTMTSPRTAPAMIGLGLLEAIPEATLLALADEGDRDGDGISGRPNYVWDVAAAREAIGRFGWKANQPSVRQQTAGAFLGDIGITSTLFPDESCPLAQEACRKAPSGGGGRDPRAPELSAQKLDAVVAYAMTIAVPARRDLADATVARGETLFREARCTSCHTPKLVTGELAEFPELSRQTIRPFTDLLLHDMGDDLADHRPDFRADGREWRTAPLWGIGLSPRVSKHALFLHDGRARGLAEAILWHGGEAKAAREAFRTMPGADRDALVAFLGSL